MDALDKARSAAWQGQLVAMEEQVAQYNSSHSAGAGGGALAVAERATTTKRESSALALADDSFRATGRRSPATAALVGVGMHQLVAARGCLPSPSIERPAAAPFAPATIDHDPQLESQIAQLEI